MIKWVDKTSYSKSDIQKGNVEPRVLSYEPSKDIRITVHRHKDYPREWLLSCYDLNIEDRRTLTDDLNEAKKRALKAIVAKIDEYNDVKDMIERAVRVESLSKLSLNDFINMGECYINSNTAKYMVVFIKTPNSEGTEVIINPRENFIQKLYYYKNAYNEDLTLKSNPNIKIINFDFINDISSQLAQSIELADNIIKKAEGVRR